MGFIPEMTKDFQQRRIEEWSDWYISFAYKVLGSLTF